MADEQGEAKRFLGALARRAEAEDRALFSIAELFSIADDLELNVPDTREFIESLNEAGVLIFPLLQLLTSTTFPSHCCKSVVSNQPEPTRYT